MTRRSYDQFCGLARALDVVGERWTLLMVRNLLLGPRRYSDLLAELPGLTTNLLAKRLSELEGHGLIEKRRLPPPAAGDVYALTEVGLALEPAVHALGAWGGQWLETPRRRDTLNLGWGFLALKRRYRGGLRGSVAFETPQRRYTLRFEGERMRVSDTDSAAVDAVVRGEADALRTLFRSGRGLEALQVEGDLQLVRRAVKALA